ncbi:MAG: LD-carboxypeptidase [Thermoleophilaceae bacterium]|nr:LD-carboxypeptidase [Thermoleophilaceae bacterium]
MSSHSPISPPRLQAGARVALIAPAGPITHADDLTRAVANARTLGWDPVLSPHVGGCHGYLSGTDAERAADLNDAIRDDSIDAIWCVRGGYGVMRILHQVDFDSLRSRPKALIGYSDITALHLAVAARCGIRSFHGPTARGFLSDFSRASLDSAVNAGRENSNPCGTALDALTLNDGRATGTLIGGNLALLCALIGTPFAARLDGAILVLEDVNEPAYRIDRLFRQLLLSGSLSRVSGIIFGAFTERGESDDSARLDSLLREIADTTGVPCIANAPVGHIANQWTFPIGATAELDASAKTLSILGNGRFT